MPEIRQLPTSVINKIAAGEVIERPASVVKELMENSVDSGATRIDVTMEKGGSELMRVSDNGCGMTPDQLPLAIASHATSKIRDADDLFNVHTLGFRGEALASISEVSQFLLRSRTEESDAGAELEVIGGKRGEIAPAGCPIGTTIEIRQLFYNTPVRRKFLRTNQTEMGHVTEAFTRIALVHQNIHFTLRHNDRVIHDLPPVDDWKDRIAAFFGEEIGQALIEINSGGENCSMMGYVADPTVSRANNRMQYLFLNGRHIRDRALQHALSEAYRGLLLTGRYPVGFLRLEVPADTVDVNVHPTKLEVRFQDGGKLYSQLLGTLRNEFLTTDLTARVQPPPSHIDAARAGAAANAIAEQKHEDELMQWAKGATQAPDGSTGSYDLAPSTPGTQGRLDMNFSSTSGNVPPFRSFDSGNSAYSGSTTSMPSNSSSNSMPLGAPPNNEFSDHSANPLATSGPAIGKHGLQIQNRYLITENDEGMVVIDQHALHERILYEKLREKTLAGRMETQRFLVPEPVMLTPEEAAAVLESKELLAELGIEIESFGDDTISVNTYPAMLSRFAPAEMLRQIADQLLEGGKKPDRRDLVDEILHMMSCKAAVKAGDRLSPEEVDSLLLQRDLCQDAHHCPHGRPTALVFTREELDRKFQRT
jgi:DNA mismatch repair protein MutL